MKSHFHFAAVFALALAIPLSAQNLPPEPDDHDDHGHDHSGAKGKFPALTISAKVDAVKDAGTGDIVRTIRGSGTTGYPEGTSLVLEAKLKGGAGYLNKKHQVHVDSEGRWEAALDDLGRNVYKGLYEVRVTFDPQFQQNSVLDAIERKQLSTKIFSQSTEIQFGTPEEEALEKADVDQLYARSFAAAKKACEDTFREFEKQVPDPQQLSWGDFVDDITEDLLRADRELGEYRRSRDNLRDVAIYEQISKLFVITTTRLYPVLTAALGLEGGRKRPEEVENAKRMMDGLRESIAALDQTIGQVKIDPKWKPADAKPIRIQPTKPPVRPIDPVGAAPPRPEGPRPTGRELVPKSRFGLAELGIGLAVLCGLAMLAVMLKRK
ncbi:MAG: hypothetical protein AAB074_08975 [Planctomycetota bacterium]